MKINVVNCIKSANCVKNLSTPDHRAYSSGLSPMKFDSLYFGNMPTFEGVKTNYTVYDKEVKMAKPLEIEPKVDFSQFGREERFFPFLKAPYADFTEANLNGTYLKSSDLNHAKFCSADLRVAKLHESNLSYCDFTNVQAEKAKFYKSNMSGVQLCSGDFMQANMQGVDFADADFNRAVFVQANFMDSDISKAKNIKTAKLEGAIYNKNTKFPTGFSPIGNYMLKLEPNADLNRIYLAGAKIKSSDTLGFEDYRKLSLKKSVLDKTQFIQLDLRNSAFDESSCNKTSFNSCILDDSSFKNCDLERADFQDSSLKDVKFGTASNLRYVNLINADLSGSNINELAYVQLKNVLFSPGTRLPQGFSIKDAKALGMIFISDNFDFSDKNLSGIKFNSCKFAQYAVNNFKNARFKKADLHYADFSGANLVNCDFTKATLENAILKNANCENAVFRTSNMACANLSGINFKNADLRGAKMQGVTYNEKTNFENAIYDQNTILPENLNPRARKMIYKETLAGALKE